VQEGKKSRHIFKHRSDNKELEHTLKRDVFTKWNSQFFLLQSLATQLNDVTGVLAANKQYEKLELLNGVD